MKKNNKGKRTRRGRMDNYDLPEEDPDWHWSPLEPEHDSVEAIDPDEDSIPEQKGKSNRNKKRTPEVRPSRVRRLKRRGAFVPLDVDPEEDDPDYEEGQDEVLAQGSDDADDNGVPDPTAPRVETVPLDRLVQVCKINTSYLLSLVDAAQYHRCWNPLGVEKVVSSIEADISQTLAVLRDLGMPLQHVGPSECVVPPSIPVADGTEVRFSDVARTLGIEWREVSDEDKASVYERAVDLHRGVFGCTPKKVLMHTSTGRRPVYFYTEETYRPTMRRALREFKMKSTGLGPFLSDENNL